jgi:NAD(P)-dependent dehydrogenase (short-subunit alcohol dehydrogenase family)
MKPREPRSLEKKVAVITGASRGIGLAIAKALAQVGCDLAIAGRHDDALRAASRELARFRTRVLIQTCDVGDPNSVDALFQNVKREYGPIDILVNNAGMSHAMATVDKLDVAMWDRVIATNLTGMFLCTRAALRMMRRSGSIVNNLSVAAKGVFAGESAYCASKHGALGFTNTLREELRPRGIRVIALLPGPTDTAIWDQFWPEAPRKKMMSPDVVAAAVVSALTLPENSTVEEMTIQPTAGSL